MGKGLRVLALDAVGDAFQLFGHVAHVVVVAAGDDAGALDVARGNDSGGQQDQTCFESSAK